MPVASSFNGWSPVFCDSGKFDVVVADRCVSANIRSDNTLFHETCATLKKSNSFEFESCVVAGVGPAVRAFVGTVSPLETALEPVAGVCLVGASLVEAVLTAVVSCGLVSASSTWRDAVTAGNLGHVDARVLAGSSLHPK